MNKKIFSFFSLLFLLVLPFVILAQTPGTPAIDVEAIITRFLNLVIWPLFVGASIIAFIWAGFLYLTAQGDSGKITTANKAIIWASVGIVIALVGFSAVNIIKTILGTP